MTRQEIIAHIQDKYDVAPEYPWNDNNLIFRHPNSKKWFGVILEVKLEKLDATLTVKPKTQDSKMADALNLKCDPSLIDDLINRPGFYRAYHMNKKYWLSINLSADIASSEIESLIELSFENVG